MITAGEVLKKKRESLGKNLDTVSLETKVQRRFLEYIENNEFDRFESEIFLTGFIKIYSQYLNLDTEKVLALYRRSNPQNLKNSKDKKTKKGNKKLIARIKTSLEKLLTPKIIISILISVFLVGILTYIGIQIYKFQSPPSLTISQPTEDFTTEEETATIKGKTLTEAVLEINEKLVEIDENGNFETTITLNPGINIITIKVRKNSNNILETVETRKITYNKPETPVVEEEQEEIIENILTLEISGASSWIRLDIDDTNKLAQVVSESKQEYKVENNFYLISGRVSNTFVYFNGEPLDWGERNTTGVAEMTCTIKDNNLNCE